MARERSTAPPPAPDGKPAKTKKVRWYKQIWQAYQMTRRAEPMVTVWILLAVLAPIAIAVPIGLAWNRLWYVLILTIPFALLAGLFVLARRAEAIAYRQIEGQPGAALSALKTIRRGWDFPEEPAAIDPRSRDMVFRGVGRAGVVLVGEGDPHRLSRLLEAERKKVARILPTVPITVLQAGSAEGQVPLRKLPRTVQKLKTKLTRQELAEVNKRLKALGGTRMPVPKGIDPFRARPDRKGMRGR
jgi:hypothetical protein